jgi:intracellular septation protein A
MEWLSLFLVLASGTATLLTDNPRFVQFKPSAIYVIVGVVMLKPGWMKGICRRSPARSCLMLPSSWASCGPA